MKNICPFLWFNNQAEDAAKFYVSVFGNSKILNSANYGEAGPGPSGTVMTIAFSINGQTFVALNGGPMYSPTPAISFFVTVGTEEEATKLWDSLIKGGKALMEFGPYPFSKKYGWLNDKYGVSWQIFVGEGGPSIRPLLMFTGLVNGRAGEAMEYYASLFPDSKISFTARYEPGTPDAGNIMHAAFQLNGQQFLAMDSGAPHKFTFTEGTSFVINCDTQEEIDAFWNKLSADKNAEQCGWLKDKYGVSWQVVPSDIGKWVSETDPVKSQKFMKAMFGMKKLNIAVLKEALQSK